MATQKYWVYGMFNHTIEAEDEEKALELVDKISLSDLEEVLITDVDEVEY
jgi:hypothetical protein